MSRRIILSKTDVARLRKILSEEARSAIRDLDDLAALGEEIDLAHIVEGSALPTDAVTLNAVVRVVDIETGAAQDYTLVPPAQADMTSRRLSVTAPLGVALLGYRRGDSAEVAQVELVGSEFNPRAQAETDAASAESKPKTKGVGGRLRAAAERLRGKKDEDAGSSRRDAKGAKKRAAKKKAEEEEE